MTPQQFLLICDPLPEPTLLLADDGLIFAANRAVEERLGIDVSTLQGKRLTEFVVESPAEVLHYLQLCCRSRSLVLGALQLHFNDSDRVVCRTEGTVIRPKKEGSAAVVLLRLLPKESAAGKFIALNQRVDELGREVQRRKWAEVEARKQEEWLQVTLHSIGDGVICTDAHGRVTIMNPVAEVLTGWTLEAAQGRPLESVFVILDEQTQEPVESPVEQVLRDGVIVGLGNHTVLIASDGTRRPIDDSAAPIRGESGEMLGVVLIFRDVTAQRRAVQDLQASEARKSAILETALDCVITMDHSGNIVDFNPAAEQTFGWPSAQVIGRPLADLIIPESLREQHREGLERYFETGQSRILGRRLELPALHANGTEFPVELAITRIAANGPPMFTAYLRDITEHRRTEQRRAIRLAATHVLNVAAGRDDGASGILQAVCENLGWDVGYFWTVNHSETALVCAQGWHRSDLTVTEFEAATFGRTFEMGEGLPGHVWSTGRPHWLLDVLVEAGFPRAASAAMYDLHSAFACPVVVGDRTLGVIEFFTKRIQEPDADLLEMMGTVAGNFGQFLERKQSEERVRQSEQELADFFDNATIGLHWVGPDGRILRANRAELELLGYRREEYVGRSVADFHADEEVIRDILERLRAGEELHEYPARLRCKDGSIKHVLIGSSALFRDGEFVHTRCFTQDVTALRRGEAVLAEQKRVLELVATGAALPDVLDAVCEVVERHSEQSIVATVLLLDSDGKRLRSVAGLRAPPGYAQAVDGVEIGPRVGSCGTAAYRAEPVIVEDIATDPLWADFRDLALGHGLRACWSTPIFSSRGKVLGTFAVYYPTPGRPSPEELRLVEVLTRTSTIAIERVRAADALRRSEQTARFLADASSALSVLVDFDSTLQRVSSLAVPSFSDWATVDLIEADGSLRRVSVSHVDPTKVQLAHAIHRRFPPDPEAPHGVWHVLRTGKSELVPELTDDLLLEIVKDEELRNILRELGLKSYIAVPLIVRSKSLGVITFINAESDHRYDQTDLAVAEDLANRASIAIENAQLYRELQDADRRKDEFLATLAHELRNPLAPIRNGLQVLRLSDSRGTIVDEARSMMERQLTQMVRLVDDLLDVSRITRNKLDLKKQTVTLEAVVQSAVETSRPVIEEAGHTLTLSLPPEPVSLDADLTRLAQVFSNLLNNSAKYTEPGGRISLTVHVNGKEVAVKVRDNGLGIPAEALPRLFQIFSQVERHMERAQGGLGIGLTLVKRIAEMHGGTVEARSAGPGKGSEFTVRLPVLSYELCPQRTAAGNSAEVDDRNATTARQRILIVDDNRDSATTLGMMLKLMGNETQTAHDGLAAVEAAEQFRPDLILLDIGLPKLNGYDACRRIRQQTWAKHIVIVALTGWGQEEDRRRSQEAGFDHHLVKPVEMADLQMLLGAR